MTNPLLQTQPNLSIASASEELKLNVPTVTASLKHLAHLGIVREATGGNEELRRKLATQDRKHPTHVPGFSTNMHELMAVADLIITKPGGLTTSEALALGKPLFILNPIPGQEAANSDFLLEHGAAAKANRVEDLPYRVEQLLGSKKLSEMGKLAKSLGRANAAQAICREVLARAKVSNPAK